MGMASGNTQLGLLLDFTVLQEPPRKLIGFQNELQM